MDWVLGARLVPWGLEEAHSSLWQDFILGAVLGHGHPESTTDEPRAWQLQDPAKAWGWR